MPKLLAINIKNQMYTLLKSAHNNVLNNIPIKINIPPIVGVPTFLKIWSIGPSSLIGPVIFLCEKYLMKGPPIRKTIIIEEIKDRPVLNVKYLNTFKKVN